MGGTLTIDGSQGEGGGQVLRTVLGLAALKGQRVRIERVRGGRRRPGLLRQHLTALRAVAQITEAAVEGAELGSGAITFEPRTLRGGDYHFTVASSGSACLVFQTVLWPLLFADEPSRVVFEGGTHNPLAPPFDFIARTFVPLLERMGARVALTLEQHGFHPGGGGRFVAEIEPVRALEPLELVDSGPIERRHARALVAKLPHAVGRRELGVVRKRVGWSADECQLEVIEHAASAGNVLLLHIERAGVCETVTGFGQRGVPAERVAATACEELERLLASEAPVGAHLADQLVIPLALGGGALVTAAPSEHLRTNIDVVAQMLGRRLRVSPRAGERVLISATAA